MTDLEYMDRAEALLRRIELACDRINEDTEADIDNQRVGGMVTLTFPDRSQIVVNLQKPLHEIWLASRSGGYHFVFDGTHWADTKSGVDFYVQLSRDASVQAGLPLDFTAA